MRKNSAFSLIEVTVAMVLAGLLAASVVAAFSGAIAGQAKSKHEWSAFSIAQQTMEQLAAMRPIAPKIAPNVTATPAPGTVADATCAGIPVAPPPLGQHYQVNALGDFDAAGAYELCWRVTGGSPSGTLSNVRVLVFYPSGTGTDHVMLQTIRGN